MLTALEGMLLRVSDGQFGHPYLLLGPSLPALGFDFTHQSVEVSCSHGFFEQLCGSFQLFPALDPHQIVAG